MLWTKKPYIHSKPPIDFPQVDFNMVSNPAALPLDGEPIPDEDNAELEDNIPLQEAFQAIQAGARLLAQGVRRRQPQQQLGQDEEVQGLGREQGQVVGAGHQGDQHGCWVLE